MEGEYKMNKSNGEYLWQQGNNVNKHLLQNNQI